MGNVPDVWVAHFYYYNILIHNKFSILLFKTAGVYYPVPLFFMSKISLVCNRGQSHVSDVWVEQKYAVIA